MAFNLFGKKTKDQTGGIFTDKTYISTTAKMNACLDLANKEPDTVFISWFDETTRKFKEFFAQNGLEEPRVIQSRFLHTQMLQNKKAILVEHYPLHAKEMELVHN